MTLMEDRAVCNVMEVFNAADGLQEALDTAAEDLFDGSHETDLPLARVVLDLLRDISLLACRAVPLDIPPVTVTPSQVYLLVHQCSMIALRCRQTAMALCLLDALVTFLPQAPAAPLLRGWLLFCSGKTAEANVSLQRVVDGPSPSVDAYVVYALVCMLRGELRLATAHTAKASLLAQRLIEDPRGWVSAQGVKAKAFASTVNAEVLARSQGRATREATATAWDDAVDAADVGNTAPLTAILLESGSSFTWTVNDYHNASIVPVGPRHCTVLHGYAVALHADLHAAVRPLEWAAWLQEVPHEAAPAAPDHVVQEQWVQPVIRRTKSVSVPPKSPAPAPAPKVFAAPADPCVVRRASFSHMKRRSSVIIAPRPAKPGGDLIAAAVACVAILAVAAMQRDAKHNEAQSRHRFGGSMRRPSATFTFTFPPPPSEGIERPAPDKDMNYKIRFVPKPPGGEVPPSERTAATPSVPARRTSTGGRGAAPVVRPKSAPPRPSRTPSTGAPRYAPPATVAPSMPLGLSPPDRGAAMAHDFSVMDEEYVPITRMYRDLQQGRTATANGAAAAPTAGIGAGGYGPVQFMRGRPTSITTTGPATTFLDPYKYP